MNIRALVLAGVAVAGMSLTAHSQIVLQSSVIGSGGGPMSNGTMTMNGTIGQAIIGPVNSTGVFVGQGFWYSANPTSDVKPSHQVGTAAGFELAQNYPNPFNPSTTIQFSVPERTKVTLRVMNLLGEEVARVIDQEEKEAGTWSVDFNATDLPSGTYVYRLEAGNLIKTKKMVLMK